MEVIADHIVELRTSLKATYVPAYNGGWDEPSYSESVEDLDITALVVERRVYGTTKWVDVDILKGVDRANPEVQKLLNNLILAIGGEADEALCEAVPDREDA